MMTDEKKHAILGPSKADQWMTCLGSTEASLGIEGTTSSYAEEGTDHHEVAAVCLDEGIEAAELIGRPMLSGAMLTEENAAFVQSYLDFVRAHKDEDGHLLVEEEVPLTHLTGEPDAIGTSDAVVLRTDRELFVADLKFGRGVSVSPERNRQAMLYALGVVEKHQVAEEYDTIRIGISQPRNGGNSDWVVSMKDLLTFGEEVKATAKKILVVVDGQMHFNRDLPKTPSEKACQFCKAKATCETLKNEVLHAMTAGFEMLDGDLADHAHFTALKQDLDTLPVPDKLGRLLALSDLAELWIKAVRGSAESELLAGRDVTGYKLVQGKKGNRKWINEQEVEEKLKSWRFTREDIYNYSVISPTDAQKLLEKKNPKRWDALKSMYSQSEGAIHVAPTTDKRPTYVPEKAEEGFTAVDDASDLI